MQCFLLEFHLSVLKCENEILLRVLYWTARLWPQIASSITTYGNIDFMTSRLVETCYLVSRGLNDEFVSLGHDIIIYQV